MFCPRIIHAIIPKGKSDFWRHPFPISLQSIVPEWSNLSMVLSEFVRRQITDAASI